ncbi:alpha hydrolase [Candidatus Parcubacteria bacterium]|nr:alpha hydrolase [Candidatus Parcubacteria bacterium]
MKVSILFSGGKDSCLAAVLLSKFFEVELVTCSFGILSNWKKAEEVAKKLGFSFNELKTSSFKVLKLDKKILEEAAEKIIQDSFPANGIKYIHQKALETLAEQTELIADGIRRDDRVPVLSLAEVKHLEDKFNIHYIQPLMGYSRKTINILVDKFFKIKEYKSTDFVGAEYEFELREYIKKKYGAGKIKEIFPQNHTQSIVVDIKEKIC